MLLKLDEITTIKKTFSPGWKGDLGFLAVYAEHHHRGTQHRAPIKPASDHKIHRHRRIVQDY